MEDCFKYSLSILFQKPYTVKTFINECGDRVCKIRAGLIMRCWLMTDYNWSNICMIETLHCRCPTSVITKLYNDQFKRPLSYLFDIRRGAGGSSLLNIFINMRNICTINKKQKQTHNTSFSVFDSMDFTLNRGCLPLQLALCYNRALSRAVALVSRDRCVTLAYMRGFNM